MAKNSGLDLEAENQELRAALLVLLDQVDYTQGACGPTEMVAACLPEEVIAKARAALAKTRRAPGGEHDGKE